MIDFNEYKKYFDDYAARYDHTDGRVIIAGCIIVKVFFIFIEIDHWQEIPFLGDPVSLPENEAPDFGGDRICL